MSFHFQSILWIYLEFWPSYGTDLLVQYVHDSLFLQVSNSNSENVQQILASYYLQLMDIHWFDVQSDGNMCNLENLVLELYPHYESLYSNTLELF